MKVENRCRICGSTKNEVLFDFPKTFFWYGASNDYLEKIIGSKYLDAIILFCNQCGFMGLPIDDSLRELLSVVYNSFQSVPGATPGTQSSYSFRLADDFFRTFWNLAPGWIPGKILEVGCQGGYLLHKFERLGAAKAIGVEPGDVKPYVDEDGNPSDIRRGFFSHDIVGEDSFELIFSLHVLEHIEYPNEFLSTAYSLLKVGGKLLLAVPNELFSLKDGNVGMFLFQHLNYFTPGSLEALLLANGFSVCGMISSRHESLYVMAEKKDQRIVNSVYKSQGDDTRKLLMAYKDKVNKKLNYIRGISNETGKKALGFYGVAGSSNIFSWISQLSERPCAVFDSDSSTWGKAYGGIPVSVQPPRMLSTVSDIIVVPYRLQGEIVQFLQAQHGGSLRIHKLYEF